jgi:hypothetical protein
MDGHRRSKHDVLALMRRLGKVDKLDEAERILPDPVDIDRDAHLLTQLGMSIDSAVNELGGSPY